MRTEGRGVRDDGHDRRSADREMLIRAAIRSWRDSLIDLTGASRLISFTPGTTGTIRLVRPSAGDVLARLAAGGSYTFRSPEPPAGHATAAGGPGEPVPGPGGRPPGAAPAVNILDTDKNPGDLASALRALMRRSDQQYLDRGCWVLYLAFGSLTWADENQTRYTSPLLLIPVRLVTTAPRQLPVLEPTGDDPVVNPALSLKLSQYGVILPRVDDLAEMTLGALLDAVRAAGAAKGGWQIGETAVLSCFSTGKEATYRDLLEHEDL